MATALQLSVGDAKFNFIQSAMVPDAESLRRLSKHLVDTRPRTNPRIAFPGCPTPSDLDILSSGTPDNNLTEADLIALRELREDLIAVGERAHARGIRITVDAEHRYASPSSSFRFRKLKWRILVGTRYVWPYPGDLGV